MEITKIIIAAVLVFGLASAAYDNQYYPKLSSDVETTISGGGGGTTNNYYTDNFDQSLNTTDNVKFNSTNTTKLYTQLIDFSDRAINITNSNYIPQILIGYASTADIYGISVGSYSNANNRGVSIGYASASNDGGVGIGYGTEAYNEGVSIGYNSYGRNGGSAVGYGSQGQGKGNIAIGYASNANDDAGFSDTAEIGTGTATHNCSLHYKGNRLMDCNGVLYGFNASVGNISNVPSTDAGNMVLDYVLDNVNPFLYGDGTYQAFRVYSYKNLFGNKVFSLVADSGLWQIANDGNSYNLNFSWDSVPNVEGYYIFIYIESFGWNYDQYAITTNPNYYLNYFTYFTYDYYSGDEASVITNQDNVSNYGYVQSDYSSLTKIYNGYYYSPLISIDGTGLEANEVKLKRKSLQTEMVLDFCNGVQSYSCGVFSEVGGELLSYGINIDQLADRDQTKKGAIFRMDTRGGYPPFTVLTTAPYGTERQSLRVTENASTLIGDSWNNIDINASLGIRTRSLGGQIASFRDENNNEKFLVNNTISIFNTNTSLSRGSSYVNFAVCYMKNGILGHCTNAVNATGGCTCAYN